MASSMSEQGEPTPYNQDGDSNSEDGDILPVYALLTEASADAIKEKRKITSIPEYAVVDKAYKGRSLTPPLKSTGSEGRVKEMPKQRSLSYSVKPRDSENIPTEERFKLLTANAVSKPQSPFYPPQPYVPKHNTDTTALNDSAEVVKSKPPSTSFSQGIYEQGDAQITDEQPGYSNPYMNVANSKRNRESRKSSLDSKTRFSGILQMTNLNFINRRNVESRSKVRRSSSRVLDFIQHMWLHIFVVLSIVIILACVIAVLAEVSKLRQPEQSTLTSSEVEKFLSRFSNDVTLNNSYISAINAVLDDFASKLSPSSNGTQPRVCPLCDYCSADLGESNCTSAKVAELDLSNNSTSCPSEFTLRMNNSVHTSCDSTRTSPTGGCTSVFYYTNMTYSKVYGRITAYQYGFTNSFQMFRNNRGNQTIDEAYVDGVSLTYGMPRQHIWTFAADKDKSTSFCPCGSNDVSIPPFVGRDYFCDTGEADMNTLSTSRLWDGRGCDGSYSCCGYNSPPWFYKQLPYPTSEPIELRVCTDQSTSNENIELESILIYVLS